MKWRGCIAGIGVVVMVCCDADDSAVDVLLLQRLVLMSPLLPAVLRPLMVVVPRPQMRCR